MAESGKANGDGGPFFRRAAYGNGAAMFFDDLLDRGETQPNPGPLRGEKRLKDLIDDFCGNWSPVILDEDMILHATPRAMLGDLNMEMPPGAHRFTRVPENTEEGLLKFRFVPADRRDDCCVVFGHLYPGDFEVGRDHRQRALDDFGDAEEPSSQFERFGKVQNLVQDGFDPNQIAHGVFDPRLRVEIQDAFTRDFFQLGADGGERLTHFSGQKHAELPDRGLPLLFSDNGLRRAWGDSDSGGAGWSSDRGMVVRSRCLENVRDLHNRRFKRAGIRLLIEAGLFRAQRNRPADLSSDEKRDNE